MYYTNANYFYSFFKIFLKCSKHTRFKLCITYIILHTNYTHLTLYTLCITFVCMNYEFKNLCKHTLVAIITMVLGLLILNSI